MRPPWDAERLYGNPEEDEAYQANKEIRKQRSDKVPSPADILVERRGGMPD
jgi:hypothetical protein